MRHEFAMKKQKRKFAKKKRKRNIKVNERIINNVTKNKNEKMRKKNLFSKQTLTLHERMNQINMKKEMMKKK